MIKIISLSVNTILIPILIIQNWILYYPKICIYEICFSRDHSHVTVKLKRCYVSRGKTNKSDSDRRRVHALVSCFLAGWGSGMASPQVIKECEVCQSVLCTLKRTSWLPDCVWRDWLMRYWLPIESMDFVIWL